MNAFKGVIISIRRWLGMMVVVFVLGTILAIAISARTAITHAARRVMMSVPTDLHLYLDRSAAAFEFGGESFSLRLPENYHPTVEALSNVGNLPYVRAYDVYLEALLFSHEFEWISPVVCAEGFSDELINIFERELLGDVNGGATMERIPVKGVGNPSIIDIELDQITMVAGRVFTAEEIASGAMLAVIPAIFAQRNGLDVGATMMLESIVHDTLAIENAGIISFDYEIRMNWHDERFYAHHEVLEFEVIGIFDVTHQLSRANLFGRTYWEIASLVRELAELYNRIYAPFAVADDILRAESVAHYEVYGGELELARFWLFRHFQLRADPLTKATFVLTDVNDLDDFRNAATELLPRFWYVNETINIVAETALSGVSSMLEIAYLILILTVGTMVITLTLTFVLHLKNKKSAGKNAKLVAHFLTEIFLASTLGLGLSLFTGYILSEAVTRNIFKQLIINQISETVDATPRMEAPFSPIFDSGEPLLEEVLSIYEPAFAGEVIMMVVGVSFAVVLISTIAPVVQIFKLEKEG